MWYIKAWSKVVVMMSKGSDETDDARVCGRCLPEVLPREVQMHIEETGGLDALERAATLPEGLPELIATFKSLSDDTRWRILSLMADGPMCACVLKSVIDVSDSRLSYHLNILRRAGMIDSRRSGSFIIYSLSSKGRGWLDALHSGDVLPVGVEG